MIIKENKNNYQNIMFIFYVWLKTKKIINILKSCSKSILKKLNRVLMNNLLLVLLFSY